VAARSRFSLVGPGRRPRQAGQEGRRQGYQ
jgi:hypothetical protein